MACYHPEIRHDTICLHYTIGSNGWPGETGLLICLFFPLAMPLLYPIGPSRLSLPNLKDIPLFDDHYHYDCSSWLSIEIPLPFFVLHRLPVHRLHTVL